MCLESIVLQSMGAANCLVTNILQSIFLSEQQKLIQLWDNLSLSKLLKNIYIFLVNYPFKENIIHYKKQLFWEWHPKALFKV